MIASVPMHEVPDADLVELARADNTEAFRCLLERYHALAFAIALHFVAQPETAQDLVQEAMLQAYLSLDHLRDATRFKSWFYGIVLNVCRYWRRRQQTSPLSLDVWNEEQPMASSGDPGSLAEERELRCAVQEAIGQLSAKNRAVTLLFYYEDLSVEEIAHLLNLSLAAVKSRLFQGRKQLQAGLYLRVIDPAMTKPPEERQQVTFQGTHDWTRSEIQVEVPPESMHILFGISLTGKGQIWVTNVQLESIPSTSEQ
jgi:RNA polymerase sigma factor (sigma-70 family)